MRLFLVTILGLAFTLGCAVGKDQADDDGDADGDGDGGDIVPPADPPVVYYVSRDADGNTYEDTDAADLCRSGSTFLGTLAGAAACLEDGVHGVLAPMSDVDGGTYPETLDDEADLCPAGWDYVGGNGWTATCVRDGTASSVYLYYGPDGDYYEDTDSRGDVCPDGWAYVGGSWYGAPLCVIDDLRPVTSVYENVDGEIIDDLDDPADTCAAGWEYLGTWYGWAQCAADGGTTIALYQRPDGATAEEVPYDEMCGDGWEFVGSYYGYAVCWTSTARTVSTLYAGADGTAYDGVDSGDDVCPAGWEFLGAVGGAAVCAD
jgi:hypothetical protein